jgi:hypothetical protein
MRNYADEILFIETARTERFVPILASSETCSHTENANHPARPLLRAQWVLVDGKLELRWSDDREEPLRCAA